MLLHEYDEAYFAALTAALPANRTTRAYVTGVFVDQVRRPIDLSRESLVLLYSANPDYTTAQHIADWVLWTLTWYPDALEPYRATVETIGRLAYLRCYRTVPTWRVFDELADCLPWYVDVLQEAVRQR